MSYSVDATRWEPMTCNEHVGSQMTALGVALLFYVKPYLCCIHKVCDASCSSNV